MISISNYIQIDKGFLNRTRGQRFNVYIKTLNGNQENFVLFADKSLKHQKKLRELLESGELGQPLYIEKREQDEYFMQIAEQLRKMASENLVSPKVITQKLYLAAKAITKDIFENGFSESLLDTADGVVDTMRSFFSESDIKFNELASVLAKDMEAYTHAINVASYCLALGKHFKLNSKDTYALGIGAIFHDIGLVSVPKEVLAKEGSFHDFGTLPKMKPVRVQMGGDDLCLQNHPARGRNILEKIKRYPKTVLDIVEQHHESYDGSGYPNGLNGESIPLLSKICKIADTYDTLRNPKFYRSNSYDPFHALNIMVKDLKGQFDPRLIKEFIIIMGS